MLKLSPPPPPPQYLGPRTSLCVTKEICGPLKVCMIPAADVNGVTDEEIPSDYKKALESEELLGNHNMLECRRASRSPEKAWRDQWSPAKPCRYFMGLIWWNRYCSEALRVWRVQGTTAELLPNPLIRGLGRTLYNVGERMGPSESLVGHLYTLTKTFKSANRFTRHLYTRPEPLTALQVAKRNRF